MAKKAAWLVCPKCDKTDETVIPHHIGTKTNMRCAPARKCCPTGHGEA